jgi:hypothetical protein
MKVMVLLQILCGLQAPPSKFDRPGVNQFLCVHRRVQHANCFESEFEIGPGDDLQQFE